MKSLLSRCSALTMTVLITILASSCRDEASAPSKRPLLIEKAWTVVKYEMNGVDITDDREACEIDNTTTFFTDGTFIDDIGNSPCEEFETDTDGTWTFKGNETIIRIHPSGDSPSEWNILELTDNTLRMSQYIQLFEAEIEVVMSPI